jgi:hypothetical protein
MTTEGWELCVQWANGTPSWLPLQVTRGIENEPAFRWWVNKTLHKVDFWVMKVKTRYHKRTHKYGIELPKTVKDALDIDARNGNTLWIEAIANDLRQQTCIQEHYISQPTLKKKHNATKRVKRKWQVSLELPRKFRNKLG